MLAGRAKRPYRTARTGWEEGGEQEQGGRGRGAGYTGTRDTHREAANAAALDDGVQDGELARGVLGHERVAGHLAAGIKTEHLLEFAHIDAVAVANGKVCGLVGIQLAVFVEVERIEQRPRHLGFGRGHGWWVGCVRAGGVCRAETRGFWSFVCGDQNLVCGDWQDRRVDLKKTS